MLKALLLRLGLLALGMAALVTVFLLGMRSKWPPVVDTMRRINRAIFNPRTLKSAGTPGASAGVLQHSGRTSGASYQTPLGIVPTSDGFAIALVYGSDTDWLKNVLAAGRATIRHEGVSYEVDRPRIVPMADAAGEFSAADRWFHALFAVDSCLRLHRVGESPA